MRSGFQNNFDEAQKDQKLTKELLISVVSFVVEME